MGYVSEKKNKESYLFKSLLLRRGKQIIKVDQGKGSVDLCGAGVIRANYIFLKRLSVGFTKNVEFEQRLEGN